MSVNYTEYVGSYTNNLVITLNGSVIQTISNYTSAASFSLSSSALSSIYSAVTTSKTVTLGFYLNTYDGSTLLGASDVVTKVLNITNSDPTIGSVTYLDTNSTTTAITGDNQYIIRNNSSLRITVSALTALNNASLSSLKLSGGGINTTITLSGSTASSEVYDAGVINQSSNFTLTATLTDSRGFRATKSIIVLVYDWVLPAAVITAQRVDNYYSTTNVKASATYSNIGGHNSITITAQYKKTSDTSYSSSVTLTDGVTTQISLDNNYEWNLKVTIADRIGSTVYNLVIGRGLPIWFLDRLLNSIGVNCFPQQENSLEVNGLRVDDKIYIGSQSIYDYYETSAAGESVVACAYDYRLIENVFAGIAIPSNYERAYKITFQYTTQNENQVTVRLNNISSNRCNTWSNDKFRSIGGTRLFKESELTLETTSGYSRNGLNLYVNNGAAYTAKIWNITIHGYLVNKDTDLDVSTYDVSDVTPEEAT